MYPTTATARKVSNTVDCVKGRESLAKTIFVKTAEKHTDRGMARKKCSAVTSFDLKNNLEMKKPGRKKIKSDASVVLANVTINSNTEFVVEYD
jgi:hypothetical protein